jgi:hypothetical protein
MRHRACRPYPSPLASVAIRLRKEWHDKWTVPASTPFTMAMISSDFGGANAIPRASTRSQSAPHLTSHLYHLSRPRPKRARFSRPLSSTMIRVTPRIQLFAVDGDHIPFASSSLRLALFPLLLFRLLSSPFPLS